MPLDLNLDKEFHPWTALFIDNTKLSMFETGTEIPFSEVLKKEALLSKFLIHLTPERAVGVDLLNGWFTFGDNSWFPAPEHVTAKLGETYRIVYYRRMQTAFDIGSTMKPPRAIKYLLGWQLTKDAENHQRILEIEPNLYYNWRKKR